MKTEELDVERTGSTNREAGAGLAPAGFVDLIDASIQEAANAGTCMLTADDAVYDGRWVRVGGEPLLNFGSCSYLGLELRNELRHAAAAATMRFGTQFPFAKPTVQCPLYQELEDALDLMTGGCTLVAPSTTLAHIAALPVLVEPGDAVLIDHFAHASLQTAVHLVRNAVVRPVRHNRLDLLAREIEALGKSHARVWYIADGVYSMLGDFAPLEGIASLMESEPKLHLYADDAHATSWFGTHGRGRTLELLPDHSRVVVALSLNKAFSAAGGALVFPDAKLRDRVRRCGASLLFSGPIQPPMLGAAVASAKLHLSPELGVLQEQLARRISLALKLAHQLGIPLGSDDATPLFFVPCGTPERAFDVVQRLRGHGIHVCVSVFPAVPIHTGGVRFTISLHNAEEDIESFLKCLGRIMASQGVVQ